MIKQKAENNLQRTKTVFFRHWSFAIGNLLLLLVVFFVPSCKDEQDDFKADYEYEYYPLDSGRYIIYDVDSITYRWQPTVGTDYVQYRDTIRYQLKEFYAGEFFDSFQGNLKYRIEYSKRKNENEPWQNDRVWYALKTSTSLQRQEDDLRFLKLVFPPRQDYTWDGTSLIPKTGIYEFLTDWKFKYVDVGKPLSVNGKDFEKTLTVTHINTGESNLLEYQYSKEIYAKGVGIIYKDWDKIEKQLVGSSWENPQKAVGHRLRMRVNSYYP
jgi:hypothetical protein